MNTKQALDILIAVAICSTNNIGFSCSDCPMAPEECELTKSSEVVEEAIRLLKDVKIVDPNPAIPGQWLLAKMLKEPERPEVIIPINHLTKEKLKNILESLNIELLEENDG